MMLEGIRVLDVATLAAAPLAATYLGEFGADVIKVEQPDGGDPIRTWGNQVDGVGLMLREVRVDGRLRFCAADFPEIQNLQRGFTRLAPRSRRAHARPAIV